MPASQSLGQKIFPDDSGSNIQAILQQITAGQPHFDSSSISKAPVPLGLQSTPGNAARGVSPGGLGGGIEGGLPFSVQAGLGTGAGAGGATPTSTSPAGTSSVVGNMLSGAGGGAGDTGGFSAPAAPSPNLTIGQSPQANVLAAGPSALSNPVVASIISQMLSKTAGQSGPETSNDAGGLDRSVGSPDLTGYGA